MQKISNAKEKKEFNNIKGKMKGEMKKSILGDLIHNKALKNKEIKEMFKAVFKKGGIRWI